MVRRLCCGLALLALTACGDDGKTLTSGVGQTFPTPPPSTGASATGTAGMTSTGEPTTSATETSGPDLTTGTATDVTATTTTSTTDPSTSTSTTGPTVECGNGVIEVTEECDGNALAGQTCTSLGFVGGTLTCSGSCFFDVSQCGGDTPCGDGTKNAGEDCDCGQKPSPCTATQLGNSACVDLPAPKNGNYHGGTLTCGTPQSCVFNTSACTYCGDGVRNGPEQCEGASLGGQTCVSLGFSGGTLACNALCTFNTAGCVGEGVCGDGTCDDNEDSCSCAADCPDDPNSCSPCQCGGNGGSCYCDLECVQAGDCCPNGPC